MKTNNIQIGGTHYKKLKYQPWDFFNDLKLHYLQCCIIKYTVRWRDKNGIEDLKKALHYVDKAIDLKIKKPFLKRDNVNLIDDFCYQLGSYETAIVRYTVNFRFNAASLVLTDLLKTTANKQNYFKG